MKRNFNNTPAPPAFVPVAETNKAKDVILSMLKEDEPDNLQTFLLINTLFSLISDDGSGVARPELPEQLEKFHMFKVCSRYMKSPNGEHHTRELERLKDNLKLACGAREGEYPSADEFRFCKDLQGHEVSFLQIVIIHHTVDQLYTLEGYLDKWKLVCFSTSLLAIPVISSDDNESQSAPTGPLAPTHEAKERTSYPMKQNGLTRQEKHAGQGYTRIAKRYRAVPLS